MCTPQDTNPLVQPLLNMAAPGANPRKFAEKIAQHVQKGAEEEAEFRKIMAELAAVKQGDRVSDIPHVPTTSNFFWYL